ncbi:hypothetical protein JCM9140_1578 [Halalkalibacter wakoensis JCM 9140]|uniref:HEAT repeat domain-containing protein n=1 Tax=Halalkalibacter wakoensis JCM 9140 TaxID=1236970 RepID=W4Q0S3_9BACI|nr:hypothetical protein [Halalkalibacter wakoensis]GAE25577.1 hypothetical protein JCM9140_1578 [Halalkalibacter wakoensis JCM 9140]
MEQSIQQVLKDLASKDKQIQYEAYQTIIEVTKEEVDWAYEVWDQLREEVTNKDAHKRSRAAQFLANLAISDPEKRIIQDFSAVWEVMKDEKFVTARHSLQAIWRVGLAGEEQREMVVNHLRERYLNCLTEKNYTLIRFDIMEGLGKLYDATKNEEIKQQALELIQDESDEKYQKKYAKVWKNR